MHNDSIPNNLIVLFILWQDKCELQQIYTVQHCLLLKFSYNCSSKYLIRVVPLNNTSDVAHTVI